MPNHPPTSFRLSPAARALLAARAAGEGLTVTAYLEHLIRRDAADHERSKAVKREVDFTIDHIILFDEGESRRALIQYADGTEARYARDFQMAPEDAIAELREQFGPTVRILDRTGGDDDE